MTTRWNGRCRADPARYPGDRLAGSCRSPPWSRGLSRDRSCAQHGELAISAISFCETAWLLRAGRMSLPMATPEWRASILAAGMREVPLDGEIAIAAVELPDFHKDPAD